ncbi:MAG: type III pantothenate kinase [Cryomorphaceae bacterium]
MHRINYEKLLEISIAISMRYLLIDNSNTRTKFMIGTEEELLPWIGHVDTAEISAKTIAKVLEDQIWDAVYLCSVVPVKAKIIEASLDFLAGKQFKKLTPGSILGIGINYPIPSQIGADRLANSIAATALYGSPCIVIDFGTAVTFDIIDDQKYQGGVIAPGLGAMTDYLANKTALLPKITLTEPESAIGKSTEIAMDIGAVYGYRGLVREIITELSKELKSKPTVICTGGDGELITDGLPDLIHHYHPSITLEGIRIAATLNF